MSRRPKEGADNSDTRGVPLISPQCQSATARGWGEYYWQAKKARLELLLPATDRSNSRASATGSEYGHSHKSLSKAKKEIRQQLDNLTPPQLARLDTQQHESSTLWQHWRSMQNTSHMAAFTQHGSKHSRSMAARIHPRSMAVYSQHGSIYEHGSKHSRSMGAFTQHGSIHAAWQQEDIPHGSIHAARQQVVLSCSSRRGKAKLSYMAACAQHSHRHSNSMAAFTRHGSIYAAWQHLRSMVALMQHSHKNTSTAAFAQHGSMRAA
ncbi:hypothetical protein BDZ91DRAFT_796868 [Kalaharituber pfeilii]|nr:hypothetical protein BDZ91DRAFT_796868 [Kalaharituber pfeilii]